MTGHSLGWGTLEEKQIGVKERDGFRFGDVWGAQERECSCGWKVAIEAVGVGEGWRAFIVLGEEGASPLGGAQRSGRNP